MKQFVVVFACLVAAAAANPSLLRPRIVIPKLPPSPDYDGEAHARALGPLPLEPELARKLARVPQPPLAGRMDTSPLIIGGADAAIGQFPWQASIVMDGSYFCGGSIISDVWILTAGHCVDGQTSFAVTVGTLRSNAGTEPSRQTFTSRDKYLHPQYNNIFIDNDIGLLKLPKQIEFSEFVKPVRLPSYSLAQDLLEGQKVLISGWGRTSDQSSVSPTLKYVDLPVVKNKVCEKIYGNVMIGTKLCCSTENIKSTCNGDSGGPLVLREADGQYTEVGIVSFGAAEGCTKKFPVAFTRVTSFLEFIEETTNIAIRD